VGRGGVVTAVLGGALGRARRMSTTIAVRQWYRKAADQGAADAQNILGVIYDIGGSVSGRVRVLPWGGQTP